MFTGLLTTNEYINSIKISGILLIAVFFSGCEREEADRLPADEIFPDCRLTEIDFVVSYGVNQKTIFEYEDGKLLRRLFYSNGIFRSIKMFEYDENGEARNMYEYDSLADENRIIASYEFENHLIKSFTHFNTSDSSVIQSLTFYYSDKHLRRMVTENPGGKYEFEINTDEKGNVIYRKMVRANEKKPETLFETVFVMDDKLNPFHRMPDFFSSFAFFNQNNITRITNIVDRTDTSEFVYSNNYYENRLLKTEYHQSFQGTHTKAFYYECY